MSYPTLNIKTYKASADYSTTGQYLFVKLSDDETVVVCSTKGEDNIGVLMNAPSSGTAAEVAMIGGGALIELAGTIVRNAKITTNGDGEAIEPDAAGQIISAMVLESGVDGDVVGCNLTIGESHS